MVLAGVAAVVVSDNGGSGCGVIMVVMVAIEKVIFIQC